MEQSEATGSAPEPEQAKQEVDGAVPLSEFRRVFAEMKRWKQKYRGQLAKDEVIREKEEEIGRLVGVVRELRVQRSLVEAARRQEAVDPEQVASLLGKFVQLDEEYAPVVVDENGNRRFTRNGRPLGTDDLVREFLSAHPHHKRAVLSGGAGSTPQSTAPEGTLLDALRNARSFRELERLVETHRRNLPSEE